MRLLFLCGGLEPGRDGVGDYTRSLAAECVRQGHEVRLLALNDHLAARVLNEPQLAEATPVPCVRYPAARPGRERFADAAREVEAFAPDWISLQFVPYGFHPKGIPWRLARGLEKIIAGRPLQLMFHELWIGFGPGAPLKERLVGALQRRCIFDLVRRLRPRAVHTSNAAYAVLLDNGGVRAEVLPIFGNIPVVPNAPLPAAFLEAGIPLELAERRQWLVGLFFGTIHPEWEPEALIEPLMRAATSEGRRVALVSAGRLGVSGEAAWERMGRAYGNDGAQIRFIRCGELPPAEISALMQTADFGVAVSPWLLLDKSGSAAAMADHGLPVVFTRADGAPPQDGPFFFRCGKDREFPRFSRREPARRLGEICARFLESLPVS